MKLSELAGKLGLTRAGDGDPEVTGVASIQSAGVHDLVFTEGEKALDEARTSKAAAVIAAEPVSGKPTLISTHPKLTFARAAQLVLGSATTRSGIHPSAVVDLTARVAPDASIGALCFVGPGVVIGGGTRIGEGCVLIGRATIGSNCELVARVTVYPETTIGDRVTVHAGAVLGSDGFGYVRDRETGEYVKFPQQGRLDIEDDVEIGANATIDRGALDATVIGRGTKIDNLVHVGHNVRIGTNVVIAGQTGVSGSSVIEDGVIVGGQVGIAEHVTIESGAILGAQAGVPSNKVIRGKGMVFWGTPARPIKDYLKELAILARLARGKGKRD
jgi:UDP-3-O-[3-hydroxymyristoyl] glucosamine N-acyltransferase